eukprot:scaffold13.g265.t1
MAPLWVSKDPDRWEQALGRYAEVLEERRDPKHKLSELDRWYYNELPNEIGADGMSKDQYQRAVDWVLKRGASRPNLAKWARERDEAQVLDATRRAMEALQAGPNNAAGQPGDQAVEAALQQILTELHGVGVGTATALLAAFDATHSICWLGDKGVDDLHDKKSLSTKQAVRLLAALRDKADELTAASGEEWTAVDVEKALFVEARGSGVETSTGAGKRKR